MRVALRCLPILLAVLLAACASPEDKVAGHLEKARSLMAEENFEKAKLEAKSAVQIEPKNAAGPCDPRQGGLARQQVP